MTPFWHRICRSEAANPVPEAEQPRSGARFRRPGPGSSRQYGSRADEPALAAAGRLRRARGPGHRGGTLTAYLATGNELREQVDTFLLRRGEEILQGPAAAARATATRAPGRATGRVRRPRRPFAPDVITQVLDDDGDVVRLVRRRAAGRRRGPSDRRRRIDRRPPAAHGHRRRASTTGSSPSHLEGGGAVQIARELTETNDALSALGGRHDPDHARRRRPGRGRGLAGRRAPDPAGPGAGRHRRAGGGDPGPVHADPGAGRPTRSAGCASSFNTMLGGAGRLPAPAAAADPGRQPRAAHPADQPAHQRRAAGAGPRPRSRRAGPAAGRRRQRVQGARASWSTSWSSWPPSSAAEAPFTDVALDEVVERAVRLSRDRTGRHDHGRRAPPVDRRRRRRPAGSGRAQPARQRRQVRARRARRSTSGCRRSTAGPG